MSTVAPGKAEFACPYPAVARTAAAARAAGATVTIEASRAASPTDSVNPADAAVAASAAAAAVLPGATRDTGSAGAAVTARSTVAIGADHSLRQHTGADRSA